jgi:hypothetical protein
MATIDIYDLSVTYHEKVDPTDTQVDRVRNLHVIGNAAFTDDRTLSFGDEGIADSYIKYANTGAHLTFYDRTTGAKTLAQLSAAASPTLDLAYDGGQVIDGAVSEATAVQIGGASDYFSIWQEGANDVRIDTSAGANIALDAAGGYINILSDSTKLGFGAAGGATDAYEYFDGTDLVFYDSHLGTTVTLSQMAANNLTSPTITGDPIISDGKLTWTDVADETVLSITADSVTASDVVSISADGLVTSAILNLSATEATLNGGFYITCYDETAGADVFKVGEDGATTITGVASTVLTLTLGNEVITNGDIAMAEGKITVDSTADETTYVKRNNAASANAVVEIEQTHTGATGSALLIDQNATGAAKGLEITHDGDNAAIDITAGAARTGPVINVTMANQLNQRAFYVTGAWTGQNAYGLIDLNSSGALTADASLLKLTSSGNIAAANDGALLELVESGNAQATTYCLRIASTNNEALHVDTGLSLFDERVTITLADNTGPALAITNPDTTGNSDAVTITPSGTGSGLAIACQTATGKALTATSVNSQTANLVYLDGTTGAAGWIGADAKGILSINTDGTFAHANSTALLITNTGTAQANARGTSLRIVDTNAPASGGYAVYLSATNANNEALYVDDGVVLIDETLKATGGLMTKVAVTDVASPPTQANMDSAFGDSAAGNSGMVALINDNNADTAMWLCASNGANWWYVAMTKGG